MPTKRQKYNKEFHFKGDIKKSNKCPYYDIKIKRLINNKHFDEFKAFQWLFKPLQDKDKVCKNCKFVRIGDYFRDLIDEDIFGRKEYDYYFDYVYDNIYTKGYPFICCEKMKEYGLQDDDLNKEDGIKCCLNGRCDNFKQAIYDSEIDCLEMLKAINFINTKDYPGKLRILLSVDEYFIEKFGKHYNREEKLEWLLDELKKFHNIEDKKLVEIKNKSDKSICPGCQLNMEFLPMINLKNISKDIVIKESESKEVYFCHNCKKHFIYIYKLDKVLTY